jgi:putative ABC transport system permease protein
MSILMTIRIALKALGRNKLRTALTMLGMIIGVAAVIAMVALGTGAQAMIEDQIRAAGTNLITIYAGSFNGPGGARGGAGTSVRLQPSDIEAIRYLPSVQYIAESVDTRSQMIYGNQNWNTRIEGTNVDLPAIRSWAVKYGTFFSEEDVRAASKVVVLGSNVSDTLFGEGVDPTDMQVRLRNHVFRVVGVMAPKGSSGGGMNMDDQVFIPYTTLMKKLTGQQYLSRIYVSATSAEQIQPAIQQITEALRIAHELAPGEEDDFMIQTLDDIVAVRTQATNTMTNLLAGIAGVSLVVGGIGIMNIMLVSVTERTREIGLRLAIGARSFDVLLQFLIEAIVISIVGGAAGIAIGYLVSELLRIYQGMAASIPVNAVLVAVLFSAAVGIFFGFYPARKAANLDPIVALKFE